MLGRRLWSLFGKEEGMRVLGAGRLADSSSASFTLPTSGKTVFTEIITTYDSSSHMFGFGKGYGTIYAANGTALAEITSSGTIGKKINSTWGITYAIFEVDE